MFDWDQYFKLAEELGKSNPLNCGIEAQLRCAISRAYYSVLIPARDVVAKKNNEKAPQQGVHGWTIGRLKSMPEPGAKRAGSLLGRMKKMRDTADYNGIYNKINKELIAVLRDRKRVKEELSKLH